MDLVDYHIHCNYSWDNENKVGDIIEHISKSKKFRDACIVAHFEPSTFGIMKKPNSIMNDQIDTFLGEVERYNSEFGQKVKAGLEVEYEESHEKVLEEVLSEYNLDFVLGSCHWITGFDGKRYLISGGVQGTRNLFNKYSPEEVVQIYFSKLKTAIGSELFDSMAHLDVIKRNTREICLYFPKESCLEHLPATAKLLKETNTCFEINTNPTNQTWADSIYPSVESIQLLYKYGVRNVTIGSDAHTLDRIGNRVPAITNLLKNIGFGYICTFKQRKMQKIPLKSF